MFDIAICDDDPTQLGLLVACTTEWINTSSFESSIHQFLHPDELLRSCEKRRYHLYILDIVMPMFNGIEAGKAIREHDRDAFILYTTSEPSFALQSFAANPIGYLLKPIDKQQFNTTLSLVASKLNLMQEHTYLIYTRDGIRILRLSEIICCEYTNHRVIYTLKGNRTATTSIITGSFANHVQTLLQDQRFVRPHVSFLLNMDYVIGFTKTRFNLQERASVPIVSKHYQAVRESYMNHLSAKGNT